MHNSIRIHEKKNKKLDNLSMFSRLSFVFFLAYSACCFLAYGGWIVQKLNWSHHPHISSVDTFIDFCCFEFLIGTLYLHVYRSVHLLVPCAMFLTCFVFGALGQVQTINVACNQNLDQVRSTLNRVCCEKEQQIPINHAAACDNAWFIYYALNAGVSLRHVNCNGMFVVVFLEVHSFFMM